MAYMLAWGSCLLCRALFCFNPYRVPSVRVDGERQPICQNCITAANEARIKKGLQPFPILEGAYEPEPEEEEESL